MDTGADKKTCEGAHALVEAGVPIRLAAYLHGLPTWTLRRVCARHGLPLEDARKAYLAANPDVARMGGRRQADHGLDHALAMPVERVAALGRLTGSRVAAVLREVSSTRVVPDITVDGKRGRVYQRIAPEAMERVRTAVMGGGSVSAAAKAEGVDGSAARHALVASGVSSAELKAAANRRDLEAVRALQQAEGIGFKSACIRLYGLKGYARLNDVLFRERKCIAA